MWVFAEVFFVIGLFGLLASTALFPIIALCLALLKGTRPTGSIKSSTNENSIKLGSLAVLIPAHNEEDVIQESITSIQAVGDALIGAGVLTSLTIIVGADHCNDATALSAKESGALVLERTHGHGSPSPGKWHTICDLIAKLPDLEPTKSDLIALVDAGTTWEIKGSNQAFAHFNDGTIAAVAPTFLRGGGGYMEAISWWIEQKLKSIENLVGGPMSVHGATAVYRRDILEQSINRLEELRKTRHRKTHRPLVPDCKLWYNDDVVIPLVLRGQTQQLNRIRYESSWIVTDISETQNKMINDRREAASRQKLRMMWGNVQWLCTPLWLSSTTVTLLSLRRAARMLWFYWFIFICCGLYPFFILVDAWIGPLLCTGILITVIGVMSGLVPNKLMPSSLVGAARASIAAPFYLAYAALNTSTKNSVQWD